MMVLWSPSARAFFDREFNREIPDDVIEMWPGEHAALLAEQDAGKVIVPGEDGRPVAVDPVVTPEQRAAHARGERDARLRACDWMTLRALERGEPMPSAWAAYRQALRDVPAQSGFPDVINWPEVPA